MKSTAKTVTAYLKSLPPERRSILEQVRQVILKNLPQGYEEAMNWGMICYEIPLTQFSDTYNKQPLLYAALASQKNYMAVYLMNVYSDSTLENWFKREYQKSGKKLNMGKSCIRFKELTDLPLDLIGAAVAKTSVSDYIDKYKASRHITD